MREKVTEEYEEKPTLILIHFLHNQLHITSTKFHLNPTHRKGDRSQKGATHTHTHACARTQKHTQTGKR